MSTPTAPTSGGAAPSSAPAAASAPSTSSSPPASAGSSSASSSNNAPAAAPSSSGGGDPGAKHLGGQSAPESATPASAEAARQEQIRKMKLKVNGKEMEMDEAEVIRRAQLSSAADEKFREAAEIRKQSEQFINTLMENPMAVLTHPQLAEKIKFRELAEQFLAKELQKELMSPEQRELHELREYRKAQEEQAAKTQKEQMTKTQQAEMAKLQQRAAQEYDSKITDVLAKSDLPKTAYTVKRVAELLHNALQKGYDLDVQTAVDMVREGYLGDIQSLVGGLDGDALIKTLGPDLIKKLRKYDLAQIKAKLEPQAAPQLSAQPVPPSSARADEPRQMRQNEWLEAIRKKAGV